MLCGTHDTVPTSYELEGVMREGDYRLRISRVIEIWKGRYKDESVALKVLKSRRGPHTSQFKEVSMSRTPQRTVVLTDGTAALL